MRYAYYVVSYGQTANGWGLVGSHILRNKKISNFEEIENITEFVREKNGYEKLIVLSWYRIKVPKEARRKQWERILQLLISRFLTRKDT